MKVWTNNKFEGFWPDGAAAVVVADHASDAVDYLNHALKEAGLPESAKVEDMKELLIRDGEYRILCDGNY